MNDITKAKNQVAADVGVVEEEETLNNALSKFRLLPENAIPIPHTIGTRFSDFFDEGVEMLQEPHKEWKENIKTFTATNTDVSYPEENLVRTTVESLVDYTYMRNPTPEASAMTDDGKELATLLQKALIALMGKKSYPGINLRPKVLKQIISGHLTNFGILELTWQDEKGSLEQVMKINQQVKEKIKEEQDPETAGPLYELLDILQRELDVRRSVGLNVRVRSPFCLIVDPNCQEADLSDAKIVMDRDVMKIDHIRAEYMIKSDEDDCYYYRYDKNVQFDMASSVSNAKVSTETAIIEAIMPDVSDAQAKLRVKDTLPIVWVYDRTTKLKYLYIEGQFETPLWVFEDTMGLSRFFPFFILSFSAPLTSIVQSGEVAHYIPFQREINKINRLVTRVRDRAFNKYVYDSSAIDPQEAKKLFEFIETPGTEDGVVALGIKLRDADKTLSTMFEPVKVPSAQFTEMFDKTDLTAALDRTTRISDAMRGAQFRTNTTNDAVGTYNEFASNRLEGLTDKIEITVEDLLWSMSELIVSKMTTQNISQLLTESEASKFKNMTVAEFNANYNLTIAAGSIEKPTSSSKKKEAMQIIQMLGQFGTAAPKTVIGIVAKLLRSAFSRVLVTDKDLESLEQESQQMAQQQQQQPQVPQKAQ